jgi:plastocyanin
MTWPWRIFSDVVGRPPTKFVLSLLIAAICAAEASGATVSGSVRLVDSRDTAVRRKGDYSGVVVWLDSIGGPPPASRPRTVRIVQKDKRFSPHIVTIPVGSSVDMPHVDPIFHNAFSNFAGQPFDVGLYAPGTTEKVRFTREGVVRVFCNIHPTMSAVIVVTPTPYASITSRSGEFTIEGVEPGHYKLRVFHERSSEQTLKALEQRVNIDQLNLQVGPLTISESGYIEVPHKNKYGADYPPVIEDRPAYHPGKR